MRKAKLPTLACLTLLVLLASCRHVEEQPVESLQQLQSFIKAKHQQSAEQDDAQFDISTGSTQSEGDEYLIQLSSSSYDTYDASEDLEFSSEKFLLVDSSNSDDSESFLEPIYDDSQEDSISSDDEPINAQPAPKKQQQTKANELTPPSKQVNQKETMLKLAKELQHSIKSQQPQQPHEVIALQLLESSSSYDSYDDSSEQVFLEEPINTKKSTGLSELNTRKSQDLSESESEGEPIEPMRSPSFTQSQEQFKPRKQIDEPVKLRREIHESEGEEPVIFRKPAPPSLEFLESESENENEKSMSSMGRQTGSVSFLELESSNNPEKARQEEPALSQSFLSNQANLKFRPRTTETVPTLPPASNPIEEFLAHEAGPSRPKPNGVIFLQREQSVQTEEKKSSNTNDRDQTELSQLQSSFKEKDADDLQQPEVDRVPQSPYLQQKISQPQEIEMKQNLDFLLIQQKQPLKIDDEQDQQLKEAMNQIRQLQEQVQHLAEQQRQALDAGAIGKQQNPELVFVPRETGQEELMSQLKPLEVESGRLVCNEGIAACSLCNTEFYFELDEDNWYFLGLQHKFKQFPKINRFRKEFQLLVQDIREQFSDAAVAIAFSKNNEVCFSSESMPHPVALASTLRYFTGASLESFIWHQLPIPSEGQLVSMQTVALVEQGSRFFTFRNFSMTMSGKMVAQLPSDVTLTIDEVVFEQDNLRASISGQLKHHDTSLPMSLVFSGDEHRHKLVSSIRQKEVRGLLLPNYRDILLSVSDTYFGSTQRDLMERHLARFTVPRVSTLEITAYKDQEFSVEFRLKREK